MIKAVDSSESRSGHKPPVFYDIRFHRNGLAKDFKGETFRDLLPKGRYHWFPRLGNEAVASHDGGLKIADPFAAKVLLEEAIGYAADGRRVMFFCACEYPRHCHRHAVASLILKEANRIGRRVQIVEWPGGKPTRQTIRVADSAFDALSRGLMNIPLGDRAVQKHQVCLPWGSIIDIENRGEKIPIVTGPAKFHHGGWMLPVFEQAETASDRSRLVTFSARFRRDHGLNATESVSDHTTAPEIKVLSVRQPWANAIVHLGKDIENRSWRANYKGRVLIHASGHRETKARKLLAEHMSPPPSESSLKNLPTSCIVGTVDLFDYVENSKSRWAEKGLWHWRLRAAKTLKPVPCLGHLGLWTPSAALIRKLPKWLTSSLSRTRR